MELNRPSPTSDESLSSEIRPSISQRPIKEKVSPTLIFSVIVSILVLIILGVAIAYRTTVIFSAKQSQPTQIMAVSTDPETNTPAKAEERDKQRLDDIEMLLTAIKKYKETGAGEGIYFPRNLVEAVDQEHKERIFELRQNAEYGYKQSDDGTNFFLLIPMETTEAYNEYVSDSVGRNTLRFNRDSAAYQKIAID